MKKVFVKANTGKIPVKKAAFRLVKLFRSEGVKVEYDRAIAKLLGKKITDPKKSDAELFISLGGDGTFLNLARSIFPASAPVIGVNLGSLGFMAEIKLEKMAETLLKVLRGSYHLDRRMVLETKSGSKGLIAINEFVVSGTMGRVIRIQVSVDGEYVNTYSADGFIISTPTGSTAYSLSAGGPIVNPGVKGIILSPICPHTLTNRPLIISEESTVKLKVLLRGSKASLIADGQQRVEIKEGSEFTIRKSENTVNMVIPSVNSYYKILREKLRWG